MNLNELRDEAYRIACEHGFHEEEHRDEHWLMLVITEISEAVDADRKGRRANYSEFTKDMEEYKVFLPPEERKRLFNLYFVKYIKGSVEEELADVVIRLLDFAGLRGIDLSNVPTGCIDGSFIWQCYFLCEKICLYRYEGTLDEVLVRNVMSYVFCIAKGMGINLLSYVGMKMKYNSMREYKHGKKY
ncbi:hypothetical protein [Bacteroides pyogenes]|uniref:hypothetical protein n=1 Tax=Bacteroides pyogenes TaxID=310300 RepID=UPI00373632E5